MTNKEMIKLISQKSGYNELVVNTVIKAYMEIQKNTATKAKPRAKR